MSGCGFFVEATAGFLVAYMGVSFWLEGTGSFWFRRNPTTKATFLADAHLAPCVRRGRSACSRPKKHAKVLVEFGQ